MPAQFAVMLESLSSFFTQLGGYLPRVLGALVVLFLGWVIARWVRTGATKALKSIRIDEAAQKSGIDEALKSGGVPFTMGGVVSSLLYWLVMLVALLAAIDSLGLAVASEVLNRVVLYIPNVVVAVLIVVFGALFSNLIRGIVATYLAGAKVSGAKTISTLSQFAIQLFAASLALVQLGIGQALITSAFQIGFGAVCLALAIAFGLGGREWAARTIDRATKNS